MGSIKDAGKTHKRHKTTKVRSSYHRSIIGTGKKLGFEVGLDSTRRRKVTIEVSSFAVEGQENSESKASCVFRDDPYQSLQCCASRHIGHTSALLSGTNHS